MKWNIERPSNEQKSIDIKSYWQAFIRTFKMLPGTMREFQTMIEVAGKAKSYKVNGEAKDQEWIVKNRQMLESYMYDDMRENGFVPILDASTKLGWEYNEDKNTFSFTLEAKAIRVGKNKAKKIGGVILSQGIAIDKDGKAASIVTVK